MLRGCAHLKALTHFDYVARNRGNFKCKNVRVLRELARHLDMDGVSLESRSEIYNIFRAESRAAK